MSSLLQFSGGVKSVQRGVTGSGTANVDVTITSVNMNKSFISQGSTGGYSTLVGSNYVGCSTSAYLLNATTVRVNAQGIAGSTITTCWEVIEFY